MNDLRLALSIILAFPLAIIVYYILAAIWPVIFPYSTTFLKYASTFSSPVYIAFPIGSAILFYVFLEWLEKEKISDPRSPITLLVLLFIVFFAYYLGISGFYFFRFFDLNVQNVAFTYFLYVPYWTSLGGLLAAWISYVIPLPNLFKKEEASSSR